MKERFCFWSIARGASKAGARELVNSARRLGLFKDFHIWTDGAVEGAICHDISTCRLRGALSALQLLPRVAAKLRYDYFVWLAPDTLFTRLPGDVLRVLNGAPVHASLEYDTTVPSPRRPDWGPCSLANFTKLMAFNGVHSHAIFTVDDGFWIVHHDAVEIFCQLAHHFSWFAKEAGYRFEFAPLLAYASQMLCGNPYLHRLTETADLWAPVRNRTPGRAPPNGTWNYVDPFTGKVLKVRPAMVHLQRAGHTLTL